MGNQWYYIAFIGTKTGSLYERFEKEGFNHVMIFYPNVGDNPSTCPYYNVIEHVKTYVSFGVIERDTLEEYLKSAIVLEVRSRRKPKAKWWWWIPTPDTCVTIAKQILGIQKPFIWTPYQLYKHILKEHKWAEL